MQTQRFDEFTYKCRKCDKTTRHLERIVTDTLPPNVKTLECTVCGAMSVCLMAAMND